MTPTFSILMPVYNAERHLDVAVASIVAQDFADWEMIAVDDGSTDGSPEILQRWASRDARIRLVRNATNIGQTASLNRGLGECRGNWVARQDADDLSDPRRLSAQRRYLARHPQTILLGTQGVLIDEHGSNIGLLDVPADAVAIAWCTPFLNPFLHTAVVFRRDVVQQEGGYDESFRIAQDYELWARLVARYPAGNLPDRLISYRHAESSLSKRGRGLAFDEASRVSAREAERWLGRGWSPAEVGLVSAFRSGLPRESKKDFWYLIATLEKEKGQQLPPTLRAAWHLKLAGTGDRVDAAEILAAFRAAPRYTSKWLYQRFVNF
ncbi:MAG: hypothetical protein RIQ71_19 [Verrucomicrobiota bacterium]|jgi:glycosyltransferase involved in cell wall biosynthesis